MTQSYSPKMTPNPHEQILKMIANENILISDKLMKLEVENKELFSRYHKLKRVFYDLLEQHNELREKAGLVPARYDWIDAAGLLDDAE